MSDYLAHARSADDVWHILSSLFALYSDDDEGFDAEGLKAEFMGWAAARPVAPMSGQWERLAYAILNFVPEPKQSEYRAQLDRIKSE